MGRWHLAVVVVLFAGSLVALVASSGLALWGTDEFAARDQIRTAALDLAAAHDLLTLPPDQPGGVETDADNRRLAEATRRVLEAYPGAEGGVYLPASDQFAGTVLLTDTPAPEKEAKDKKLGKKEKKDADKKSPPAGTRRDPPPKETEPIRRQCRDALAVDAADRVVVEIRDIGPSRVAVAVAPVGAGRPARAAVWVMTRLTGPEQQKTRMAQLQMATAASLGGVVVALCLAAGLGWSLRREGGRQAALREDLRRAEHLASLGRLLAGVAHEVRNPLAAIRSTVQLWERLPAQARTPESLAAVIRAVDRLNELVSRLLLFARAGHEPCRVVDLNAVAAEAGELLRAQADAHRVAVETDLTPGLPPVAAAESAVRQVVLNLGTNALQAMPQGGRLTITTRPLPGGRVELVVADTGPGVPAEVREKVFEPFFTTRPEGTGLGLALCREVARQHGGDVTLDPSPGPGAMFRLVLPAADGKMS
ncbi:MAG TPA: ATP-binding protein [Urbifossiella sp.]|nr:ATP-binding protein [Urbifossiella sp.]